MRTSAYTYTQPSNSSAVFSTPAHTARRERCRPHEISYTDRVYASLTLAGHVVAEVTRERVSDFSALITMLRALVPTRRGLARLRVRNLTRGWSLERPLMLYAEPGTEVEPAILMPWHTH